MAYIDKNSPVTEEECIAVIDKALELGCTHLDTSNVREFSAAASNLQPVCALSHPHDQLYQLLIMPQISCHHHTGGPPLIGLNLLQVYGPETNERLVGMTKMLTERIRTEQDAKWAKIQNSALLHAYVMLQINLQSASCAPAELPLMELM